MNQMLPIYAYFTDFIDLLRRFNWQNQSAILLDIKRNGRVIFLTEKPFLSSVHQIDELTDYHTGRRN
jgi:hypothetical protein